MLLAAREGEPRISLKAAFYAVSAQNQLSAAFELRTPKLLIKSNTLLTVSDNGLDVEGGFSLLPKNESLYSFEFRSPPGWRVTAVRFADGTPLSFETYKAQDGDRIRISFEQGIAEAQEQVVQFQARFIPPDWFSSWNQQSIDLPAFTVGNADRQEGAFGVRTTDDIVATPNVTTGLITLTDGEKQEFQLQDTSAGYVYRFLTPAWNASFNLERQQPRVTARVFSNFRFNPNSLETHGEIIFLIQDASADKLSFSLPETTPEEISVRALDGLKIKESNSETLDGRRRWSVELAERHSGPVRLAIDFTEPIAPAAYIGYVLPSLRAEQVDYQSGAMSLEGHPELETQISKAPRAVDVGELADEDYTAGKRLSGVYGYLGEDDELIVDLALRQVSALPATLVEHVDITTRVAENGVQQTSAAYRIRTKANYLVLQLPPGAELWSIYLDAAPALPQQEDNRILVPLPANNTGDYRVLRLVYETATAESLQLRSDIRLSAPELYARPSRDVIGERIPVADVSWQVVLPSGFRLVAADGSRVERAFVWQGFLDTMWKLGGGSPGPWLLQPIRSAALANRQLAEKAGMRIDDVADMADRKSRAANAQSVPNDSLNGSDFAANPATTRFGRTDAAQETQPSSGQIADDPVDLPRAPAAGAASLDSAPLVFGSAEAWSGSNLGRQQFQSGRWALQGLRSLDVRIAADASDSSRSADLLALGGHSSVHLTVVDQRRTQWIAPGIALLVFLMGLTRGTWPSRLRYLAAVAVAVTLLATWLSPNLDSLAVQSYVIGSVLLLLFYYLLSTVKAGLRSFVERLFLGRPSRPGKGTMKTVSSAVAWLAVTSLCSPAGIAQSPQQLAPLAPQPLSPFPVQSIDTIENFESIAGLEQLLAALTSGEKASIPEDAVVIPYDPESNANVSFTEKLLVPLAVYRELVSLAKQRQEAAIQDPPMDYAWSGATYTATLEGDASLVMQGKLRIQQFVARKIAIPLIINGCLIEEITVDAQPASLKLVEAASMRQLRASQSLETSLETAQQALTQTASSQQVSSPQVSSPQMSSQPAASQQQSEVRDQARGGDGVYLLVTSGLGVHEVGIKLRWRIDTQGGWRRAVGQLPAAPASSLDLIVRSPNTEVRLSGLDAGTAITTQEENEAIESALGPEGKISLSWRDQVSEAVVDQGLAVKSRAVFDVQEDALRLAWQGDFEFPRGQRETLSIRVPGDYLVEKLVGSNVRGWESIPPDDTLPNGGQQQLKIELLKPATDRETLTMVISQRRNIFGDESSVINLPSVFIPDAVSQEGEFTIRRSRIVDVRTLEAAGVSRIDVPDESGWLMSLEVPSPMSRQTYQAYRFNQPDYRLVLSGSLAKQKLVADTQTLIKISQQATLLETRLILNATGRPVHKLVLRLPTDVLLDALRIDGAFEWSVIERSDLAADGEQLVEVYLANGRVGEFSIVLTGSIGPPGVDREQTRSVPLPTVITIGAERQSGTIVVQSDPAYDVSTQDLRGCELALLDTADAWLAPKQRELAQLAIAHATTDYSGSLVISPRIPTVKTLTASNVKVTDRAVEETIFLEATISSAGIREFVFQLPAYLANARIQAPLIRRKNVSLVDTDDDSPVRVRLEFQDALTGQLAIIVTHDRLLQAQGQLVPIPIIETGETSERFLSLENASRDELLTSRPVSVESLDRSQLARLPELRESVAKSSFLYRVNEAQAALTPPSLTFQTNSRQTVVTAAARIGLARTSLVMDAAGAFRGLVEFRVENRTEPYLDIRLPREARLWTAQVAGEPVKPTVAANAGDVRLPLTKTAEGDLDYPVVIKYGGQLPKPGWFSQTKFPLIETVNLNVELSQVKLWLPDDYRWTQFEGTLGQVKSESDLQAGWLSFRTKQIGELTDLLSASGKMYSKMRAQNNLKQLSAAVEQQKLLLEGRSENLEKQLLENSFALQRASEQVSEFQSQVASAEMFQGNRLSLAKRYNEQQNTKSVQVVDELGSNFDVSVGQQSAVNRGSGPGAQQDSQLPNEDAKYFDDAWFYQNRLGNQSSVAEDKSAVTDLDFTDGEDGRSKSLSQNVPQLGQRPAILEQEEVAKQDRGQQQILGDYRWQAEKYNRKLEQQSLEREAEVVQQPTRSQLSLPPGSTRTEEAAPRVLSMNAGGRVRSRNSLGTQLRNVQPTDASLAEGLSLGLDVRGGFAGQSLAMQSTSESAAVGGSQRGAEGAAGATSYLASLDLELPFRGTQFMFSTPGGELQLSGRSVAMDLIDRLISSAIILMLAALIALVFRWGRPVPAGRFGRNVLIWCLGLVGAISLLGGILPVYGIFALLTSVAILFALPTGAPASPGED